MADDHRGPYERYARRLREQLRVDALGVLIIDGTDQAWAHSARNGRDPVVVRAFAKALRKIADELDAAADRTAKRMS